MKQDIIMNRRQFMAAGAGLGLSTLLPNMGRGESWNGREVLNPELTCLAKVKAVNTYDIPAHLTQLPHKLIQIDVECLAIDSFGTNFPLNLFFDPPMHPVESDKIVQNLKIGAVYWVHGDWMIADAETPMTIYNPEYRSYEPVDLKWEWSKSDMRRFRENPPTA